MMRLRMTVAYDGTRYAGWQIQPGEVTIQGELERLVRQVSGASVRMHSSGRTDTGVHARAQVVHFDLESSIEPASLQLALNRLLHEDIRILDVAMTSPDFHARRSATGKQYRYFIWDGAVLPPFVRLYRTHVKRPLDTDAMREAARWLLGRNDFAAFAANPSRDVGSTIRDLRRLDVERNEDEISIIAEADGFLYKMVRSLAGFLIRVGQGDQTADDAAAILTSRLRTARVPTAASRGLFLWEVYYA